MPWGARVRHDLTLETCDLKFSCQCSVYNSVVPSLCFSNHHRGLMKKRIKHLALYGFFLASIISAIGCLPHIHQLPAATETPAFPLLPPPEDDTIIGIAFSGGGSRAAYFSAAGLEALSRLRLSPQSPSLLERVAYISSVSGGSVASSYFVMEKPGKNQSGQKESVLGLDGALTDRYSNIFRCLLENDGI